MQVLIGLIATILLFSSCASTEPVQAHRSQILNNPQTYNELEQLVRTVVQTHDTTEKIIDGIIVVGRITYHRPLDNGILFHVGIVIGKEKIYFSAYEPFTYNRPDSIIQVREGIWDIQ